MSDITSLGSHYLITGSPGAGKTTKARRLAKELRIPYVEVDSLPHKQNSFSDTNTVREYLKRKRSPRVIEGAQILGLTNKELAPHNVILLDTPKREVLRRLATRGLQDAFGVSHVGSDEYIQSQVAEFQDIIRKFRKRMPRNVTVLREGQRT